MQKANRSLVHEAASIWMNEGGGGLFDWRMKEKE